MSHPLRHSCGKKEKGEAGHVSSSKRQLQRALPGHSELSRAPLSTSDAMLTQAAVSEATGTPENWKELKEKWLGAKAGKEH